MLNVRVVKIGGNELDRPEWVAACARALSAIGPTVVVHGGGQAVSTWSRRLGLPVEQRDGLRVTTPEIAQLVEMVLGGPMNRLLVTALRAAGLDAMGLSGVDGVTQPTLAAAEIETMIEGGVATGGMAAKLRAAAQALRAGVRAVRIGDLDMFEHATAGTRLLTVPPSAVQTA